MLIDNFKLVFTPEEEKTLKIEAIQQIQFLCRRLNPYIWKKEENQFRTITKEKLKQLFEEAKKDEFPNQYFCSKLYSGFKKDKDDFEFFGIFLEHYSFKYKTFLDHINEELDKLCNKKYVEISNALQSRNKLIEVDLDVSVGWNFSTVLEELVEDYIRKTLYAEAFNDLELEEIFQWIDRNAPVGEFKDESYQHVKNLIKL